MNMPFMTKRYAASAALIIAFGLGPAAIAHKQHGDQDTAAPGDSAVLEDSCTAACRLPGLSSEPDKQPTTKRFAL